MIIFKRSIGLLASAILLTGCAGLSGTIRELAKDPATACITVATPYGSTAIVRAALAGVEVIGEAGRCIVRQPGR